MVKNHNFGFSKNHLIFGYFGQKNCRQWPPQIAKMTTNQHIWSQCCERLTQVIESKNILKKTCFFMTLQIYAYRNRTIEFCFDADF